MVFFSAANLWGAEIMTALGRLELDVDAVDLADEVAANGSPNWRSPVATRGPPRRCRTITANPLRADLRA